MASPGIRPGLARLARILSLAGMPQKQFAAVHIVGTNGKGSTAAGLYSILRKSGYKTALYTSPHLVSFGERLEIDGGIVDAEDWLRAADKMDGIINSDAFLSSDRPTYFELTTAAAIIILADKKPDIAVFEAGMGGRLDASNILLDAALSLIVPIGLDHTEYLGNTLQKIAAEKFAILRRGVPALFVGGEEDINMQFLETARVHGAVPHLFSKEFTIIEPKYSLAGTDFTLKNNLTGTETKLHTPLIGTFQADNAALSAAAAEILRGRFAGITTACIKEGLAQTQWPGRMEIISNKPLTLIDGGHNAHAAKRLAETVQAVIPGKKISLVLAMMRDKDIADTLNIFKSIDADLFCTEVPNNSRSFKAEEMFELASKEGLAPVGAFQEPIEAMRRAALIGSPVICCGSLYLVGYIKENFHGI